MKKSAELSTKQTLLIIGGGVVLTGGVVMLIRHLINRVKENKHHNNSFNSGSADYYAKEIQLALENPGDWGIDMPRLRRVFTSVSSQSEMGLIKDAYRRAYHKNLYEVLFDRLNATQYDELVSIKQGKPQGGNLSQGSASIPLQYQAVLWAKRLHAAISYKVLFMPQTDEDAIKAVFNEIPTQAAYAMTAAAYQNLFGNSLESDLLWDLHWEFEEYMTIIKQKPKQ